MICICAGRNYPPKKPDTKHLSLSEKSRCSFTCPFATRRLHVSPLVKERRQTRGEHSEPDSECWMWIIITPRPLSCTTHSPFPSSSCSVSTTLHFPPHIRLSSPPTWLISISSLHNCFSPLTLPTTLNPLFFFFFCFVEGSRLHYSIFIFPSS